MKKNFLQVNMIVLGYLLRKAWRLKKFFATMVLAFCISVPMTTHYALTNPVEAAIFLGEVGIIINRVEKSVDKIKQKPIDIAWEKAPKGYKKFYNKNLRAVHSYSAGVMNSYDVKVHKPRKTVWGNLATGGQKLLNGAVRIVLSPLKLIGGIV